MSNDNQFFMRKAIEGQESKIELLEKKIEEIGNVLTNLHVGVQAVQFQGEALMHILIDKKQIVTEEEAKLAVDELYQRMESMAKARSQEAETNTSSQPEGS